MIELGRCRYVCGTLDADHRHPTSRSDETLRCSVAFGCRPATTTSSDKSVMRSVRRSTRPSYHDSSPRFSSTPLVSEGGALDIRSQQPAYHRRRVGDAQQNQCEADNDDVAALVRRSSPSRRSASPPQPVGRGTNRHHPQPITSIHFDSGEIDSTLHGSDANDDEATWGLDTDRCLFETTFPVHDRRRAKLARLPVLSDDDYVEDEQNTNWQSSDLEEDQADQQRPGQTMRRWRTLEDLHYSSTDSVYVANDDGGGQTKGRKMPPIRKRYTSPERSRRASTNRRSISVPNRSIAGFYIDSDCDSTDDSSEDEPVDEDWLDEDRHRRCGDGGGDRRRNGNGAELLQLEAGSKDWLEVQREIYRVDSRAEQLFEPPSPRTTRLRSANTFPFRINQQPVPTSTTGVVAPIIRVIKKNEVQQRSAIATTNSTGEKQSTVIGETKFNQIANGLDTRVQRLLLALFTVILLVGIIYKYTSPSTPPKLEQLPPETSYDEVREYVITYVTDVFY